MVEYITVVENHNPNVSLFFVGSTIECGKFIVDEESEYAWVATKNLIHKLALKYFDKTVGNEWEIVQMYLKVVEVGECAEIYITANNINTMQSIDEIIPLWPMEKNDRKKFNYNYNKTYDDLYVDEDDPNLFQFSEGHVTLKLKSFRDLKTITSK